MSTLYKKLETIRKENNYSMEDMAKRLDITKTYYSYLEKGKRNLYYDMAVRIASIFNMKPDEIFYDEHRKRG